MRRWIAIPVIVFSMMALLISSTAAAPAAVKEGGVVMIGGMQPLSGAAAFEGKVAHIGVETAVQDINAAGGRIIGGKHYTFATKCYDHRYTSEGGATAANKLVFDDKAKYIVGTIGSAPSLAAQAITEANNVLFMTTGWNKDVIGKKKPLSFRIYTGPDEFIGVVVAWVLKKHPEVKNVAILAANDATGYGSAGPSKTYWEKAGIKVNSTDYFERGSSDFYPYLARYIDQKVDAIDLPGVASDHEALICKQARELGFRGMILGNGMMPDVINKIAGQAAEGMVVRQGVPFGSKFATPAEEKWNNRCKQQYKLDQNMNFLSLSNYDATFMLVKAMEIAGTVDNPIAVAKALDNLKFVLPLGGIKTSFQGEKTYGVNRQLVRPLYIVQNQGGNWVVIDKVMPLVP